MGFPLYMSLFCALFTKEQRSTSFIRQRGQKQDFTDHRRACGLDCRPFHRKEVWSLGGMRTVLSASEGRADLPSPKHTLGKQTSAVPLPGCRFYERGESGIPKITEEVRHIFGCQNTLQTKRWTASRRQAVAFPENQMLSCEGIKCRLCSRHQCLCWNVGEVREN